jgi:hypothetical protein
MMEPQCTSMRGHASLCCFLKQAISLFLCQFLWFENDHNLLERSRKSKRHFLHVVFDYRSTTVLADVECLIEREPNAYASRNSCLRNLLFVYKQDPSRAFTVPAPVVPKANAHQVISGGYRLA